LWRGSSPSRARKAGERNAVSRGTIDLHEVARPFSTAKGDVGRLTWKDVKLSLTTEEKALHDKLIKYRNTLYGHSDAEFVEMRIWVMRQSNPNGIDSDFVLPRFDEHMRLSLVEVNAIHELSLKLVQALFHECQKLGAKFKDRFTTYDLDIVVRR
jgi:hypothetical protein